MQGALAWILFYDPGKIKSSNMQCTTICARLVHFITRVFISCYKHTHTHVCLRPTLFCVCLLTLRHREMCNFALSFSCMHTRHAHQLLVVMSRFSLPNNLDFRTALPRCLWHARVHSTSCQLVSVSQFRSIVCFLRLSLSAWEWMWTNWRFYATETNT